MLTLLASCVPADVAIGSEYSIRAVEAGDAEALSRLYFTAYAAGDAAASIEEARDDIAATFAGGYGPLWPEASPVVVTGSRIVAAALVVHHAPWPDAPAGPFVIEVLTDRTHRRRGLARAVLSRAMRVALNGGGGTDTIGLRVGEDNTGARWLYAALGFRPWPDDGLDAGTSTRKDDAR